LAAGRGDNHVDMGTDLSARTDNRVKKEEDAEEILDFFG